MNGTQNGARGDGPPAPPLLAAYMGKLARRPLLTKEAELRLARRARSGDQEAKRRLAEHNLRLVVSVAKRYRGLGLPFEELIQEGNLGLLKAVDRYDPETGNRFSTYATWWIRQAVQRAVADKGRTIRLPAHVGEKIRLLARAEAEVDARAPGKGATAAAVAERLGWSVEDVEALRAHLAPLTSLDAPLGDDPHAASAVDLVADETSPAPGEELEDEARALALRTAVARLPERERRVVVRRHGLDGAEPATLDELAEELGVSRERVRQIQKRAQETIGRRCAAHAPAHAAAKATQTTESGS
jgi:RNA polymerase primary sigma factor